MAFSPFRANQTPACSTLEVNNPWTVASSDPGSSTGTQTWQNNLFSVSTVKMLHNLSALVGLGEKVDASASRRINAKSLDTQVQRSGRPQNHLEKPSKIIKSNHYPSTAKASTMECLQAPYPYAFWSLPGTVIPPFPWAASAKGLTTLSRKEFFLTSKCSNELPTAHAEEAQLLQLHSFWIRSESTPTPPLQEEILIKKNPLI